MNFKLYIGLTTQDNQNISKDYVLTCITKFLTGFTVYETIGYYCGQKEKSLVIEVFNHKLLSKNQLCQIAFECNQECIGEYDYNSGDYNLYFSRDYLVSDDEEYLTEHWLFKGGDN